MPLMPCKPNKPSGEVRGEKVQRREANRRRHRLTEPTPKALCQAPPPPPRVNPVVMGVAWDEKQASALPRASPCLEGGGGAVQNATSVHGVLP